MEIVYITQQQNVTGLGSLTLCNCTAWRMCRMRISTNLRFFTNGTYGWFQKLSNRSRHGPIQQARGPYGRCNGFNYVLGTPRHLHMSPHVSWRWFDDGNTMGTAVTANEKNSKCQFFQLWHCYSTWEHTVRTHAPKRILNHIEPTRIAAGVKILKKKFILRARTAPRMWAMREMRKPRSTAGFFEREVQAAPVPCVLAASSTLHQARSATGHFAGLIAMHYPGKYAHLTHFFYQC